MISGSEFKTGTVDHCGYFTKSFKEDATKTDVLAEKYEQMATDAK